MGNSQGPVNLTCYPTQPTAVNNEKNQPTASVSLLLLAHHTKYLHKTLHSGGSNSLFQLSVRTNTAAALESDRWPISYMNEAWDTWMHCCNRYIHEMYKKALHNHCTSGQAHHYELSISFFWSNLYFGHMHLTDVFLANSHYVVDVTNLVLLELDRIVDKTQDSMHVPNTTHCSWFTTDVETNRSSSPDPES